MDGATRLDAAKKQSKPAPVAIEMNSISDPCFFRRLPLRPSPRRRPLAAPGSLVAPQHGTVVERRAVDVVVIGGGALAAAAACSLARRGKKVVLIPDFGIRPLAPPPSGEGPRPLCLPATTDTLTQ